MHVCLFFVWGFSSHSRVLHSYGDVIIAGEGLKFFYLYSALMAIEQLRFFIVPHLLWHEESVYNGHIRGPLTLTPIAERFEVELSLPFFTDYVCRGWDSNTQPFACEAIALTDCATAAVQKIWNQFNLCCRCYIYGGQVGKGVSQLRVLIANVNFGDLIYPMHNFLSFIVSLLYCL